MCDRRRRILDATSRCRRYRTPSIKACAMHRRATSVGDTPITIASRNNLSRVAESNPTFTRKLPPAEPPAVAAELS